MKNTLLLLILLSFTLTFSQIGIGTDNPESNSMLDMQKYMINDKGNEGVLTLQWLYSDYSTTASNGINLHGSVFSLGGDLEKDINIDINPDDGDIHIQ